MKVNRSYSFRFYPTALQIALLAIEFGNARWVWNWALREKMENHQAAKLYPQQCEELSMFNQDLPDPVEPMSFARLGRKLTKQKQIPAFAWLKNGSSSALTQKLRDLDTAYQNFFAAACLRHFSPAGRNPPASKRRNTRKAFVCNSTNASSPTSTGPGFY